MKFLWNSLGCGYASWLGPEWWQSWDSNPRRLVSEALAHHQNREKHKQDEKRVCSSPVITSQPLLTRILREAISPMRNATFDQTTGPSSAPPGLQPNTGCGLWLWLTYRVSFQNKRTVSPQRRNQASGSKNTRQHRLCEEKAVVFLRFRVSGPQCLRGAQDQDLCLSRTSSRQNTLEAQNVINGTVWNQAAKTQCPPEPTLTPTAANTRGPGSFTGNIDAVH